jgi:predicted 3-demethylubiquinone-9 3-methyltransferase (glyoxalase superfamily)
MQKIVTFLWFDDQAEEAANYYVSVFPDSKVLSVMRQDGKVVTVTFQLAGQEFIALNGGPQFTFDEAISLFVRCERQEEVDSLWTTLTADGGEESQCGWLKDKYGLSWQIIPQQLVVMICDQSHPEQAARAMQAMLQMGKIDIDAVRRAYEGQ